MSAIAGILYFHETPLEPVLIEKLTSAMKRRGPDAQTHWVQGSVALGHCMLHTTPESIEEHQPLASQDKSLVLVWDGRLDNREELERKLNAAGAVLRDKTDAELALHSYAVWGKACPGQLLGDFAFAVWDARRQTLFCARDHIGARPFYFTRNGKFFAFASEDESLIGLPDVSREPEEERIAYFLVRDFRGFENANTWLKDVKTLMPAQTAEVSADGAARMETYWQFEPVEESAYKSDDACREAFMAVFGEAVRCRMRSNDSVALMLSGGMDSGSIAAMAMRLKPEMPDRELHTYSAISDQPESCVESQCILGITGCLQVAPHFVSVPSLAGMLGLEDLVQAAWSNAHPVNTLLLPAMMSMAAGRDGHRVILHGASGDLVMDVPDRYAAFLMRKGRWRDAWRECRDAGRNHTYLQGTHPLRLLLMNAASAFAPAGARRLARRLRQFGSPSPLSNSLINPKFANELRLKARMRESGLGSDARSPDRQQAHIGVMRPPYGLALGLAEYDRVGGRYGLEMRDPWGDKRVAEFWLGLPLEHKVRSGWMKYPVRAGFEAELPAKVRWRTGKEHLGWQFYDRLKKETLAFSRGNLEQDFGVIETYVDKKTLAGRYAQFCASQGDDGHMDIYDIITLIKWIKQIQGKDF